MFSYTTRSVYILTIVISLIIFNTLNFFLVNVQKSKETKEISKVTLTKIYFDKHEIESYKLNEANKFENSLNETSSWLIEIPKINLIAEIAEGTTEQVMNKYVGHFENTPIYNGNTCLAAHNRGYPVNYFGRLKELVKGDVIIYKTKQGIRKYEVSLTTIIKDTDWSNLKNTENNRITLITCVENQPEYRRCIQGIEIL